MDSDVVPNENIFLYDSPLQEGQEPVEGQVLIGSGTGAPPAAIAVMVALREQAGVGEPLDVKLFGFDGTQNLIHGKLDDMPDDYINRGDVVACIGDESYASIQEVYYDQMQQLVAMAYDYPALVGHIRVDGEATLSSKIFSHEFEKPRTDFSIVEGGKGISNDAPAV